MARVAGYLTDAGRFSTTSAARGAIDFSAAYATNNRQDVVQRKLSSSRPRTSIARTSASATAGIAYTAAVARSAAPAPTDRWRLRRPVRIEHVIEIRLCRA